MELAKDCVVCGKRFVKPPTCSMRTWTKKRKCCSTECGNALKRGRKNPRLGDAWRGKKQTPEHVAKRVEKIRAAHAEGRAKHARANLGLRREQTSQWKGDDIGYRAAHARLYALRGKPDACALCGTKAGPFEWALKHDAPRKLEVGGRFDGRYFSTDPADYVPACRPCHRDYDGQRERDPRTGRFLPVAD